MINPITSGAAYSGVTAPKNDKKTQESKESTQTQRSSGELSKAQSIAKKIEDGSYKIDLDALADKITDALMR